MRRLRFVAALFIVLTLASWPARSQQPTRPARIISLVPSVTEMLFAIGAGPAVVGVSNFDHYPPEAEKRPRVGGLLDPDLERVVSLRPDLVVVYGTQGDLITRLTELKLPMFNYQHSGLADITTTIRALGARVGRRDEAARVAGDIERGIADIRAQVKDKPRPRTLVVFDREPGALRTMFASGGVGFLHDMLVVAGGENVFADVKRQSVQASTELILARAPDVVLDLHSGEGWSQDRIGRELNAWRVLSSVPAIRNNRVHIMVDEVMSIPGPRVVEAIRRMMQALHPSQP